MVKTLDIGGRNRTAFNAPAEIDFDSALNATGSNAAAVVTIAADATRKNVLGQITASYSGTPTAGSIKVEDGAGTTVWGPHAITAGGPVQFNFNPALAGSTNTALVVTLAAGGSGVVGTVSVNAWRLP